MKSAADVNANDLPSTVSELNHYIDEQFHAQTPIAMDNSLVAADKAIALEKNFETLWRAARACAWLTDDGRRGMSERCISYANRAATLDRKRVEGEYYLGVTVGQLANAKKSTRLVPEVVAAGKLAILADEKFDWAGPLRLTGYTYAKAPAPPTSVGDLDEGLKALKRAVELAPKHPLNRLFFCDALLKNGDLDAAERECKVVAGTPDAPEWSHWIAAWHKEAEQKLRTIARKRHEQDSGASGIP